MEVRFGNRKRIRFSDKKHPKHGIISVVLGVLSIIILLTLCIVSGHAKGRAENGNWCARSCNDGT